MPPRPAPPRDPSQRPTGQSPARSLAVRLRSLLGRYRVGSVPVPAKAPLPGDAGSRPLKLARAILWWEALWPPLWRPLSLLGLFLALAWMGLFLHLSPWLHVPLLLAALAGVGFLAWQGLCWRLMWAMAQLQPELAMSWMQSPVVFWVEHPLWVG